MRCSVGRPSHLIINNLIFIGKVRHRTEKICDLCVRVARWRQSLELLQLPLSDELELELSEDEQDELLP